MVLAVRSGNDAWALAAEVLGLRHENIVPSQQGLPLSKLLLGARDRVYGVQSRSASTNASSSSVVV